jgi:two-component system, NarL family, sensor kinase
VSRLLTLRVPVLLALGAALAAAAAAGPLVAAPPPSPGAEMPVVLALSFIPLAVLVLRRLPGHPVGRLMLLVGGLAYLAAAAVAWSAFLPAAWLSRWLWLPAVLTIPIVLLLLPDGTLPSPRWRPLLVLAAGAGTVLTAAVAAAAAGIVVSGLAAVGVVAALALRWRRADPTVRRQLECLLPAGVLLVLGVVLDIATVPYAWLPAVVALPMGLTFAVLRGRLHDLDLHIHRGTVWAVLTGFVVATYVGVATLAGATVAEPGSPTQSVIAAAVVAALLLPAQWVAQRGVRRLLYGRRDEPYAVLTELGRTLEAVRDPLDVLPRIAASVAATLRVPYAALRVVDEDGESGTVAEHGRWAGEPESFPMVAHGAVVGELLVAPRTSAVHPSRSAS